MKRPTSSRSASTRNSTSSSKNTNSASSSAAKGNGVNNAVSQNAASSEEVISLSTFITLMYAFGLACKKTYKDNNFVMPDVDDYLPRLKKLKNISEMKMAIIDMKNDENNDNEDDETNIEDDGALASSMVETVMTNVDDSNEDEIESIANNLLPKNLADSNTGDNIKSEKEMSIIYLQIFHHLVNWLFKANCTFGFNAEILKFYLCSWIFYNDEDTYHYLKEQKINQSKQSGSFSAQQKRQTANLNVLLDYFKNTDNFQSSITRANLIALFRFIHSNRIFLPIKIYDNIKQKAFVPKDKILDYLEFDQSMQSDYVKVEVNTKKLQVQFLIVTPHVAAVYDNVPNAVLSSALMTLPIEKEILMFQHALFENEQKLMNSDAYIVLMITKNKIIDVISTNVDESIINLNDSYNQRMRSIDNIGHLKPVPMQQIYLSNNYLPNFVNKEPMTAKSSFIMIHRTDHTKPMYLYDYPCLTCLHIGTYNKHALLAFPRDENTLVYKKSVTFTQHVNIETISNLNHCIKDFSETPSVTVKFADCIKTFKIVDLPSGYEIDDDDIDENAETTDIALTGAGKKKKLNNGKQKRRKNVIDKTRCLKIFETPIFVELKEQTKSTKSCVTINTSLDTLKFSEISFEVDYDALNAREATNEITKNKLQTATVPVALGILTTNDSFMKAHQILTLCNNIEDDGKQIDDLFKTVNYNDPESMSQFIKTLQQGYEIKKNNTNNFLI